MLVNFQYQQPLSQHWGSGTFSSSDGQRFATARKTNMAAPLPRYFGFGRGLNVVTWTSDQLSQYGIRVTPPRIRESTYTLDAILDNQTALNIKEGDLVKLRTDDGEIQAKAKVDRRLPQGVFFAPYHFGELGLNRIYRGQATIAVQVG